MPSVVIDTNVLRSYTRTPARRHTFYSYCSAKTIQDSAIFFILVEQYRAHPQKRKALFLSRWFLEVRDEKDGGMPEALLENGFLSLINYQASDRNKTVASIRREADYVGKTFSDKVAKRGGGVTGFVGALIQKTMFDTTLSADHFEVAQGQIAGMLSDVYQGFSTGVYQPDGRYQPSPIFKDQVTLLRRYLRTNGFDANSAGIY